MTPPPEPDETSPSPIDGRDVPGPAAAPGDDGVDPFAGPGWHEEPGAAREPDGGPAPRRHRRRRVSRRRLRRRRRLGLGMLVVGGLIVLAGVYLVVTAFLARRSLEQVRGDVARLRAQITAGDLDGARSTANRISDRADTAHSYTSGPVWALAGDLPAGGAPFETVRTITAQIDSVGEDVLPDVVDATRELDPTSLRQADGSIDLSRIQAIAPQLDSADIAMQHATSQVADRPADTWLSPVDAARDQLLTQLRSLGKTLHSADLAARIAPDMLGADGVKRYFVGFQNDAEARGTGGLPGAFGIVKADHGKLSIVRFESDSALNGVDSGLSLGADYSRLWGASLPTSQYVDSNVSPNFPYAARIWMAMWQKKSGQALDGALAVDPQALSDLLAVTGPATLPDKSKVTAGNVVQLTQQTLYARYPSDKAAPQRKEVLLDVARAVSERVLDAKVNTTALVKAAGRAGAERRILVYSATPSVEQGLEQTSLSGVVSRTADPFVGLVVNNAGGNKLDYYLDRSVTWQRSGCGSARQVTVTAHLTNDAPANLPAYVEERNDHPPYPTRPGDNRLGVYYYGTTASLLQSATLDGKAVGHSSGYEQGHPVFVFDVELPRGNTRTLVLHFLEPAGEGAPTVLRQPLVRPLHLKIEDQSCG